MKIPDIKQFEDLIIDHLELNPKPRRGVLSSIYLSSLYTLHRHSERSERTLFTTLSEAEGYYSLSLITLYKAKTNYLIFVT